MYVYSWNEPVGVLSKDAIENKKPNEAHNSLETERGENNVWWPWKNYDDWLNGRGLKSEQPKIRERKYRKHNKDKKKNRKNNKKRKKSKAGKTQQKVTIIENNIKINDDGNEIIKKGSIPNIQYNVSPIDIILKNSSLIPTLTKYSSRNFTYGTLYFMLFII